MLADATYGFSNLDNPAMLNNLANGAISLALGELGTQIENLEATIADQAILNDALPLADVSLDEVLGITSIFGVVYFSIQDYADQSGELLSVGGLITYLEAQLHAYFEGAEYLP